MPEIHDITEIDFWSSLALPEGEPASADLSEAIRLGLAGKKEAAYSRLGVYHLTKRDVLVAIAREESAKAAKWRATELKHRTGPLNSEPQTNDLAILNAAVNALHPVALQTLKTGAPPLREFLNHTLIAIYRHSRQFPHASNFPLLSLFAHGHFQGYWTAYLALLETGGASPAAAAAALKLLLGLGREINRETSHYRVHNIFTAANYGLFHVARTMREFREAAAWEAQSLSHLDTDIDRSFYPDGGHVERNWWYGFYTVSRLTNTWNFARRTGGMAGREEHFLAGLRRAYHFFAITLDGNGVPPSYGDNGGLQPLGIAVEQARSSGVFPPETPPDLGSDNKHSCFLKESGIAILRNGAGSRDAYATISCGEFAGWHSHHDLLSLAFRAGGRLLLEEAIRWGAYEHPMDLLWRGPQAHNQLLVDGFHYDARPCRGEDVAWYSDDRVDYFSAYHTAYRALPRHEHRDFQMSADLVVRRSLLFVKDPGYLLVLDSVRNEHAEGFNRATSVWWHSPRPFRHLGPGLARTTGRTACLLAWAYPEATRRTETGDDFLPEDLDGIHPPPSDSWHYLRLRTWLDTSYPGCLGFATVLFPFAGTPPTVRIRHRPLSGGVRYRAEKFEIHTPAGLDVIVLNPEILPGLKEGGQNIAGRARIRLGNHRGSVDIS